VTDSAEAEQPEAEEESSAITTYGVGARMFFTNDLGFLWILACYMTVWASVHLSPILWDVQPSVPWLVDATAGLSVAAALTWGFGVDALEKWSSIKGGNP
jgi:hypothetical protein